MPNRLAVVLALRQDVLGNHRWDERTRSYATMPVEDVWAVEEAMAAILERVAGAVDWPRLLREATDRHQALHPEMEAAAADWTPKIGVCRECLAEALLSDQTGAPNWLQHPTTPREHGQVDWPAIVATRLVHRSAAVWHPYQDTPAGQAAAAEAAGAVMPRLDVVVDRNPNCDTDVYVYVDGAPYDEAVVHVLDPGRSGGDHEWWDTVTTHDDSVPQAVREKIEEIAGLYHDPEQCTDPCR